MTTIDADFWRGRRVLLTGHTGFKGTWLALMLDRLGATTFGVSLPAVQGEDRLWDAVDLPSVRHHEHDIAGEDWQAAAAAFEPQVVLHLAAQALVPVGYTEPMRTFSSNVQGTARVMDFLGAAAQVDVALMITTDKVYDTRQPVPFGEDAFFGGADPYSASKAAAELVVHSWPEVGTVVATARAGNVIGGGDWSADRLVPDIVRAWRAERPVRLRRPAAVRPWQHVLEPLYGYLLHAQALAAHPDTPRALNFGPDAAQCVPVATLATYAAEVWAASGRPVPPTAHEQIRTGVIGETEILELDSARAHRALGWRNVLGWEDSVRWTLEWYLRQADGEEPARLMDEQLAAYRALTEEGTR